MTQNGNVDCGIAIAYAIDIVARNNPTTTVYNQSEMRQHLLECFQNHKMKPFPRIRTLRNQVPLVDITKDINNTQNELPLENMQTENHIQITLARKLVPKVSLRY